MADKKTDKGSDYGAHAAFAAADSPKAIKANAAASTKYKHR